MTALAKARLFRLGGEKEPRVEGDPIPVQFNPSSLHVVLSSATDGPGTPARQAEQSLGAGNLRRVLGGRPHKNYLGGGGAGVSCSIRMTIPESARCTTAA